MNADKKEKISVYLCESVSPFIDGGEGLEMLAHEPYM